MNTRGPTRGKMDILQYDFIIIGSGFGGSVSALRLAQKGYRVAVLEQGSRVTPADMGGIVQSPGFWARRAWRLFMQPIYRHIGRWRRRRRRRSPVYAAVLLRPKSTFTGRGPGRARRTGRRNRAAPRHRREDAGFMLNRRSARWTRCQKDGQGHGRRHHWELRRTTSATKVQRADLLFGGDGPARASATCGECPDVPTARRTRLIKIISISRKRLARQCSPTGRR